MQSEYVTEEVDVERRREKMEDAVDEIVDEQRRMKDMSGRGEELRRRHQFLISVVMGMMEDAFVGGHGGANSE